MVEGPKFGLENIRGLFKSLTDLKLLYLETSLMENEKRGSQFKLALALENYAIETIQWHLLDRSHLVELLHISFEIFVERAGHYAPSASSTFEASEASSSSPSSSSPYARSQSTSSSCSPRTSTPKRAAWNR